MKKINKLVSYIEGIREYVTCISKDPYSKAALLISWSTDLACDFGP